MTLHPAPINSYHFYSSCSFWKRVFHKIERTVQTPTRDVLQVGGKFKAAAAAAVATRSSSAIPSRPQNHGGICGEEKNYEIEGGWTVNNSESSSESELCFPSDEELLADAFGDFVLDGCAPRATIEEYDELELEL